MTEEELDELIRKCPTLYHMAEAGSWPSIQQNGLLSASALLDKAEISGPSRERIESHGRRTKVDLRIPGFGHVVIRDQKPLIEKRLENCLGDGLKPADWCRVLNRKVFLFLEEKPLNTLLKKYSDRRHDVIWLDTRKLIGDYRKKIYLSTMNTGSTNFGILRDKSTFQSIEKFSMRDKDKKRKTIAEFTVDYAIQNIEKYIKRAERRDWECIKKVLFPTKTQ